MMGIVPRNFPQAPTDLWVILQMDSFGGGLVDQAPGGKFGKVDYVPCFATDSFMYFWKPLYEELSRYFFL